jgi:anti-sigma factor RsiW
MPSPTSSAREPMTVTENVIRDLLPLYLGGEASADSRALVEAWLVTDPAFASVVRRSADAIGALGDLAPPALDEAGVREALRRVRRIVLVREVSLGLAGALTLLPFLLAAFALLFPGRMEWTSLDEPSALIVCASLAALSWMTYFYVRGRTRSDLL